MPNFDPETGKLTPEGKEALTSIQMNPGKTAPVVRVDKESDRKIETRVGPDTTGQTIHEKDGNIHVVETITKPANALPKEK